MKKLLIFTVILTVSYLNSVGQAFNSNELEKMVRMAPQQFDGYVSKRGFKYITTTEMGGVYGTAYVYLNPNQKPSNVVLCPSGVLSYRPNSVGFARLKHEIESKYKYYSTTTEVGSQIIYYGVDTRFHVVLDDGFGRKTINVFKGLGGI